MGASETGTGRTALINVEQKPTRVSIVETFYVVYIPPVNFYMYVYIYIYIEHRERERERSWLVTPQS